MKKALLVGINKYRIPGADLRGCVNDVMNVRDVLMKYYGFNVSDIRVLVDERATKANIVERLKWLVGDARAGDSLVFHYSGHGSQVRDRNGDELRDGLDEIICPHDMDWDRTFISDDDLLAIFRSLPEGATLDVILDSCHSGTGTRAAMFHVQVGGNGLPPCMTVSARYLPPPVDILCREEPGLRTKGLFQWILNLFRSASADCEPVAQMNHALFSGCRDNQFSADAEIDGTYNGAFTYFFCRHIREAQGQIRRSDLRKKIVDSLGRSGFDQVPQLEAPERMFNGEVFR